MSSKGGSSGSPKVSYQRVRPATGASGMPGTVASALVIHRAQWSELDLAVAYAILELRVRVFVVEQACAYQDPDGLDTIASTEHRWILGATGSAGPEPQLAAYLRVLHPQPGTDVAVAVTRRIGRVVTDPACRHRGLAGRLIQSVIDDFGEGTLELHAQEHLAAWYGRFGFAIAGARYLETGIPHVPMRRTAGG